MDDLIFKYPHTDLHSVNLDYILKIVRENAGLHLEISGNQLILKTADNTIISAVTIPYATEAGSASSANSAAYASSAGSAASATYAASAGSATTATNATNAAHATAADTATSAASATTATNADHATAADTATYATSAGTAASADYATTTGSVDHALLAIENAEAYGNNLRFTKGNGATITFTPNFASKSLRDNLNNIINNTYFANVVNNNGVLEFKDASGNTVKTVTPTIANAQTDSYGNTIADYIKAITVSSNSDYVTIDHGTGTADTLTIHYSETAWKDTNGNVIKNTYVKRLEIITDPNDGHKKLVAYNGDNPEAELFRIPVEAYRAQEAAEATHAASADYATNAGAAAEATHATTSDTCKNTNIFIKAYKNNDGSYSSDSPDTMTIESITNSAGDTLSFSDIEIEDLTNVILIYHDAEVDPYLRYYSISMYQKPDISLPTSLYFNSLEVEYDNDTQKNVLSSFHASIVYRNGQLLTSSVYITSDTLN